MFGNSSKEATSCTSEESQTLDVFHFHFHFKLYVCKRLSFGTNFFAYFKKPIGRDTSSCIKLSCADSNQGYYQVELLSISHF